MEKFYDGSQGSKLLFKARTGRLEMNGGTYRWSGREENCEWCELGESETVEHLVVECSGHVRERAMMLYCLIELLGENVW